MNFHSSAASPRTFRHAHPVVALALACLTACAAAHAQTADIKAADAKPDTETYQTIYLTNLTQQINQIPGVTRRMRGIESPAT